MKFENHVLPSSLKEHLESIFYYKGFQPDHSIERVVPTGHVFIIFELDGIPRNTFDSKTLEPNGTFSRVWVSGMHKKHLSISAHQDSEMLVIQFKPTGAFPFFQLPMHKINNKVISTQEIFDNKILQLRQQILHQNNAKEKFNLVENWLLERLDDNAKTPEEIISILAKLQAKPFHEHQKIIQSYSKTQKHLINQFKKYIGLTPKVLHRIFRFNEVLNKIRSNEKLDWSQIAHQFEYADQSHFIREFNEFSGFNPSQYINSDFHKDEPNFFPLDRKG